MGNQNPHIWLAVVLSLCAAAAPALDLDQDERTALGALYDATSGPEWFDNRNWMGDGAVCGWYGVNCCVIWCTPVTVSGVFLKENNLNGEIPPEIAGLWDLRRLELHGNQLRGEIPPEIGGLSRLDELWLRENDLNGAIPSEIGNILGLELLHLGENQLGGRLPDRFMDLEYLIVLDLGSNELEGVLPADFDRLWRLSYLGLFSNRFEGALPVALTRMASLQSLDVHSNRISGPIPRQVCRTPVLERVDLRWNALYSDEPEVVAYLDARQEGGDWQSTQTIAPEGLQGHLTGDGGAQLRWTPILYQDDPGAYEVYHAHSGEDWQHVGTTGSKTDTTFTMSGLEDGVSHHFTVRTFTEPHQNNKNRVVSDAAPTLTLSSAGQLAIPAVARVRGVGVFFTSSLTAFNAGDSNLEIGLSYTPRADIGGSPLMATWSLATGAAETVDDALEYFFGITDEQRSVGSLVLSVGDADPETLMVQSVVSAHHADGAEYGQLFPAFNFGDGIQAGQVAHLHTTVDASRSRVNAGFMALEEPTSARVLLVDPVGHQLGGTVFEFVGSVGDNHQLNDVFAAFGVEPTANALVEVAVDSGSLLAYASVLDGTADSPGTSDPTTILPFTGGNDEVVLLEMGSIQGHDEFDGSASITNISAEETVVTASFFQRGWPGAEASTELTLAPGATWGCDRFISELFDVEGVVGSTVLSASEGSIAATGREYSIHRDSGGEVVGTAGQLIDGLTDSDLLGPDAAWHFIGLRQNREAGQERTNFAAFNPGSESVTLTVELFDAATGEIEGTGDFAVRGEELIHVNDLIGAINPDHDAGDKHIRIEVTGGVFMQVFGVNTSGDPVTLGAFPGS